MTPEELNQLLTQNESPTLEFKREFFIHASDGEAKRRMKDEFIKDVLSLANGNIYTAGEVSYLIIGASDIRNPDGNRELYDIGDYVLKAEDFLQIINSACQPALRSIIQDVLVLNDKRILVLTIPFSPYVHEITRRLDVVDGKSYSEYAVFTRQGASVRIASFKEQKTLLDIKQIRLEDSKNASPLLLGSLVGAVIGGPITKKVADEKKLNPVLGWIIGTIVFGMFGGSVGKAYTEYLEVRLDWHKLSTLQKILTILCGAVGIVAAEYTMLKPAKKK